MSRSRLVEVIEASGYRPRGIVQVGAHKGRKAGPYLSLGPDLIVWIDADAAWMPALNKLVVASPPATRQLALNALIADRDGVAVDFLHYSNKGWSSSLYRPAGPMLAEWPGVGPTGEVAPMTTARLETVLSGAGLSPQDVDVLAIDVSGAELDALKGAGAFLAGLEFIQVRLYRDPFYEGAPPADDVVAFLERAGFRRLTKLTEHGDVVFRRAVHAVLGGWGKHLFEHVGDPRVMLTAPHQACDGEAELIVIPCGSADDILITEAALPESVWQAARAGRAGLIFDASTEAIEHSAGRTADLHGFLAGKGVPRGRAVYLTQDRDYRRSYLDFCAASGVGDTMEVLIEDYFAWTVAYHLSDGVGEEQLADRLQRFGDRAAHRSRRFMSLNHTPRPIKVLFLMSLMRDGLWDQGYISFGGFDRHPKTARGGHRRIRKMLDRAAGFEDLAAELEGRLPELESYGQVLFTPPATRSARPFSGNMVKDQDMPEFDDCWFSVVTETEMLPRASRITEKSLKPLANFHPFIIFGNLGALKLVRELGFETFGELIDESYDDEPDPRRRFDMAYAELRRLCAMDEAELAHQVGKIAGKLEQNARHALVEMPGPGRQRHDSQLIDQILAAVGRAHLQPVADGSER